MSSSKDLFTSWTRERSLRRTYREELFLWLLSSPLKDRIAFFVQFEWHWRFFSVCDYSISDTSIQKRIWLYTILLLFYFVPLHLNLDLFWWLWNVLTVPPTLFICDFYHRIEPLFIFTFELFEHIFAEFINLSFSRVAFQCTRVIFAHQDIFLA